MIADYRTTAWQGTAALPFSVHAGNQTILGRQAGRALGRGAWPAGPWGRSWKTDNARQPTLGNTVSPPSSGSDRYISTVAILAAKRGNKLWCQRTLIRDLECRCLVGELQSWGDVPGRPRGEGQEESTS